MLYSVPNAEISRPALTVSMYQFSGVPARQEVLIDHRVFLCKCLELNQRDYLRGPLLLDPFGL